MLILLVFLCSIVLFLLSKYFGKDYESYVVYFECIINQSCDLNWEVEPLTLFLAKSVGSVLGIELLILLYIFTALISKTFALKRVDVFIIPFLIYIISFAPLLEINQIRAAVGIGFSVLAIQFYLEKKIKYALLFYITAISFHYSMVIVALFLINSRILIFICLGIPFIVSILTVEGLISFSEAYPLLSSNIRLISFASYLEAQPQSTIINSKTLLSLIISIPIALNWTPFFIRRILINNILLLFMSLISLISMPNLFSRISDIFLVTAVLFTLGYSRLKGWYKILLLLFAFFQTLISAKFIFS